MATDANGNDTVTGNPTVYGDDGQPVAQSTGYTGPAGPVPATKTAPAQTAQQPQAMDYSSLFQPGYLGNPTTINPATTTGSQYDLGSLLSQWMNPGGPQAAGGVDANQFGAGNTIQSLLQGFAPQAQRSTNNLNQTLADFGVSGGQAVGAQTQLQAQLAAALSPSIASAIQSSQGQQLSALQGNQGAQVSQNNLAAQLQGTNYGQQNSALANALGTNTANNQQANLSNQSATNNAAQYNATAANSTNAANVGQQNLSQQQMITNMLNQYYAQMGAFNQINNGGQTGSNNQALQYGGQVTTSDPFGQFMGALGQAGQAYTAGGGKFGGGGAPPPGVGAVPG